MVLVFAGILAFLIVGLVNGVSEAEHYRRVWQDPVEVSATVSAHEAYDDEGDTDFYIYIDYTVDGVAYNHIRYNSVENKTQLPPIGDKIQIQASPEDPRVLLKDLKNNPSLIFCGPMVIFLLTFACAELLMLLRSRYLPGQPDQETVVKDLRITLLANGFRPLFLLIALYMFALCWRYPMLYGDKTRGVGLICLAIWVILMVMLVKDLRKVHSGSFTIHRDLLVRKEESTDSDGDPTYTLHFSTADRTWEKRVRAAEYNLAEEGQSVHAVYLEGKKQPTLHYDRFGNAH